MSDQRPRTLTAQRRLAQKASVRARRRNARQADSREQVRRGRAFLEARLPAHNEGTSAHVPEEADLRNSLLVNNAALEIFHALYGREPQWARAWTFSYRHQCPTLYLPPKSWWLHDGDLVLAMRLEEVEVEWWEPGARYVRLVRTYSLHPHDLLEHHDRRPHRDMPWEAVAWEPVLRGDLSQPRLQASPRDPLPPPLSVPVVRLDGMPVPSPLRLSRRIVEAWIAVGRGQRLPW